MPYSNIFSKQKFPFYGIRFRKSRQGRFQPQTTFGHIRVLFFTKNKNGHKIRQTLDEPLITYNNININASFYKKNTKVFFTNGQKNSKKHKMD